MAPEFCVIAQIEGTVHVGETPERRKLGILPHRGLRTASAGRFNQDSDRVGAE